MGLRGPLGVGASERVGTNAPRQMDTWGLGGGYTCGRVVNQETVRAGADFPTRVRGSLGVSTTSPIGDRCIGGVGVGAGLEGVQVVVAAFGGHELGVGAVLDDLALI